MQIPRLTLIAALLLGICVPVLAQPGPGSGRCGPGTAASGASVDCPAGRGAGPGMRWGRNQTPGWAMMSEAERSEHAARMRDFKSHDECKTYLEQHHAQMTARAKERGQSMPARPRRDPCAGLKPAPK